MAYMNELEMKRLVWVSAAKASVGPPFFVLVI